MEIVEKQVEKIKEVPYGYWDNCGYTPYCHRGAWGGVTGSQIPASRGVAGAGLGLGIAGTALGLLALSRNGGLNLFGGSSVPENVNINTNGTGSSGWSAPTAFDVWAKESSDIFDAQKTLYDFALLQQNQRFSDRSVLNNELFGLYKSQTDSDFALYKFNRDGIDSVNNRLTNEIFSLYKETRDKDDAIKKELSDLKAQVAINSAVRPYQDKLIQCEIDKAFTAGINYTDRKTCNVIYGQVVLPNEPTVTGYVGANQCGCPRIISTTTAGA